MKNWQQMLDMNGKNGVGDVHRRDTKLTLNTGTPQG